MTERSPEPRWLDGEEMDAWLALNGVILLLPAALDSQMQRDNGITMFEYIVMAMLSEAPGRTLQLKRLARITNGSLSRLSHVVTRLEKRDWVRRRPLAENGRVTMATLTDLGYAKVVASAPSHVETVRRLVFDGLEREQVRRLQEISEQLLGSLDADCASERLAPQR
ncbi:MAG TPA: MarR family transcriptional regulator [Kineosporiaceae bacterium]|nr:MarR family transcriptional regulator [Kineosporiaceae bacterium]